MSSPRSREPTGESPSRSNWTTLRFLLRDQEGTSATLAFGAVLAGFAEAGILAAVAQVAAALLIDNSGGVLVELGPISVDLSVGTLLWIASGLAVARIALQALLSLLQARIAANVQTHLRDDLFAAFSVASWPVQSRDTEGHLQEMLTSQVVQATYGAIQVAALISALFTFIVLILSALLLNVLAAAIVLVVAASLYGLLRPLSSIGQRHAKELSLAQMQYANGVGEAVRLAEENRVFGAAEAHRARIDGLAGVARHLFFRTELVGRFIPNLYQGLIYLTVIGGLAALYATSAGPVASLGAVVLLLVRAGSYGQQVQGSYQTVRQALPFVERIREATERYRESERPVYETPLPAIHTVSFTDVSYAYRPERPVLAGMTFTVNQGELVGVIGPSGAGKSTLVQVLLQLRQPDFGTYSLNGVPASHFAPEDWHRQVAYVPQEPRLLHASVADNIRYFRPISDEMVERAAKLARIHDEIVDWQDGYETIVGPRADSVSGGQQQRLCLARALASDPALLILDEPTSSLDPRSESLIQSSLTELARHLTVFIVTHKMSVVSICDRVMVVVDGRIDGFDAPATLEQTNSYFGSASVFSGSVHHQVKPDPA